MLGSVLRTIEGPLALLPCVSQSAYAVCSHCRDDRMCGIRWLFKQVRDQTVALLDSTSLQSIVAQEINLEMLLNQQGKGDLYEI